MLWCSNLVWRLACMNATIQMHACTRTHTHAHTYTHIHTHACTYTERSYAYSYSGVPYTCTYTLTQMHIQTQTRDDPCCSCSIIHFSHILSQTLVKKRKVKAAGQPVRVGEKVLPMVRGNVCVCACVCLCLHACMRSCVFLSVCLCCFTNRLF